jgi:hypothetical protein
MRLGDCSGRGVDLGQPLGEFALECADHGTDAPRSEEHTSELQSLS